MGKKHHNKRKPKKTKPKKKDENINTRSHKLPETLKYPIENEEKNNLIKDIENNYFNFDSDSNSEEDIESNKENNAY